MGFVLMLISFAVAGIYVYQYVTGSFRLLELMRQSAPETWDALGRPEKVYVRSGEGGMYTIKPLWPWLSWVWRGSAPGLPIVVSRELRRVSRLLRISLVAFAVTAVIFVMTITTATEDSQSANNPYVGNMNDRSYSGQVTANGTVYRVSADGAEVGADQFAGRYVWAEYAAPWCSTCIRQARITRNLKAAFEKEVVFLTILTSRSPEHRAVPTQETARDWAGRFGLDPGRVVAATNLWGWTVPQHILYSPEGHTLYRRVGLHSEEQIRRTLTNYMGDWAEWADYGVTAPWMRFN